MDTDKADCGNISPLLVQMGEYLDQYQRFEHGDAMQQPGRWRDVLNQPVPDQGVGIDNVLEEIGMTIIPNGSQIPNPGCTSFITTGATNVGVLATLAGAVAAPQRIGLTAFNYLEELS
ncbi:MAG: pyridoxal-dependent decarboxylase, partial [Gammaproteobacteria bacterium]